jgi:hypothetical protein
VSSATILRLERFEFKRVVCRKQGAGRCTLESERRCIPVRDERWFSGEEITTLLASPLSYANDGDDDDDEEDEDEEEEKKKGDEDDDEEEEEPVWTLPPITGR